MSIHQKLVNLRKDLPVMRKDQKVNFGTTKYKYFEINQMIEVMKPILEKHKIAIFQPLSNVNGKPAIKTIIVDLQTDETFEDIFPIPELQDAQKLAGCTTYFRRYSLVSMLFMETEDDDAQEASGKVVKTLPQATKAKGYEPRKYSYSSVPTMSDGAPFPS